MHAEICPVCNGTGKLKYGTKAISLTNVDDKTCHGCDGKGWIEVADTPIYPPPKETSDRQKKARWE